MQIVLLIAIVLFALGGIFSTTRQLQMLQQNSYFPSRYFKWLKGAFSYKVVFSAIFLGVAILLCLLSLYIPLLIFGLLTAVTKINNAKSGQKKSIKPLVFTARVKRLYVTSIIIFAALAIVGFLVFKPILLLVLVFCYCPPITVLLARTINAPMENALGAMYIADAKRKLKSHANLKVIGITGSYGKTSTKYILASFLEQKFNVLYTPASFNTPFGIVRTVREGLRPDTQVFIAEMGAKNVGDIKEICAIANPSECIITSVGPQHLDTFKSIENVTKTKFELADWVKKNGGGIFLNTDNEYINAKASEYNHHAFGKVGDTRYENVCYTENGAEFDIISGDKTLHIKTKLLGSHNVVNITAAAGLALSLGVSERDIIFAAAKLKPVEHRLEMKTFINGSILLDDAYNANPVGCIEAVNVLGAFEGRKKVIVTPGLIELGEKEYECNYNLGKAAAEVCDTIILVGKQRAIPMKKAAEDANFSGNLMVVSSFADAMDYLRNNTKNDWVVLFENDLPDNYTK